MELRSFNVERIWRSVVKCVIGEELGVNKENLIAHKKDIESMIDQIVWTRNSSENYRIYLIRPHLQDHQGTE